MTGAVPHNIARRWTDRSPMTSEIDRDIAPDDEPTERFAVQKCPHCSAATAVALCFATARCEICGERFEVAPLIA